MPNSALFRSFAICSLLAAASAAGARADLAAELGEPAQAAALDKITAARETLNRATVLHLGARSRPARNYVFITVPYWFDDEEGNAFLETLRQRKAELSAQGRKLDIKVLQDWSSPVSEGDVLGKGMFRKIRYLAEGWAFLWNRPWSLRTWSLDLLNNRLHDKLMVVDGEKLLMGGMNIADPYLKGGESREGWHDTDVLFEGPAAQEGARLFLKPFLFQRYINRPGNSVPAGAVSRARFMEQYFELGRSDISYPAGRKSTRATRIPIDEFLESENYFPSSVVKESEDPKAASERQAPVRLIYDNPLVDRALGRGSKLLSTLEYLLPQARASVRLFIPYLSISARMIRLLTATARRGVRVQIVTNSRASSDIGVVSYQGSLPNYLPLLKAGVEIHEWQGHDSIEAFERKHRCEAKGYWPGKTLHTKAVVIDGSVALIGSHNLNFRSERMNSELMALVRDPGFARQVSAIFDEDLRVRDSDRAAEPLVRCGSLAFVRPPRTLPVTLARLERIFKAQGLWLRFLHLFQALM